MKRINQNSDFDLRVNLKGADLSVPFRFTYFTNNSERFVASYDGSEYVNCTREDNENIVVHFNNHGLKTGILYVVSEFDLDNEKYADGQLNMVTKQETGVMIVTGASSCINANYSVMPMYQKGPSAYDLAKLNGYEGTEDDYVNGPIRNEDARKSAEIARNNAESTRNRNEEIRKALEEIRKTKELERNTEEGKRKLAEDARVSAEGLRDKAEIERVGKDKLRDVAEGKRDTAEGLRDSAEKARVKAEGDRDKAEKARQEAENTRSTEYYNRIGNEDYRINNEINRVGAEVGRAAQEEARIAAENKRKDECDKMIGESTALINAAVTSANNATASANNAAKLANDAVTSANNATASANNAAKLANDAVSGIDSKIESAITERIEGIESRVSEPAFLPSGCVCSSKFCNVKSGDFSIECYIKKSFLISQWDNVFTFVRDGVAISSISVGDRFINFLNSAANIPRTGYIHYVATINNDVLSIYINGKKSDTQNIQYGVFDNCDIYSIYNSKNTQIESISLFRHYNYALTQSDVDSLYNQGRPLDVKLGDEWKNDGTSANIAFRGNKVDTYTISGYVTILSGSVLDEFTPQSLTRTKWLNTGVNKGNDIALTDAKFTYEPPVKERQWCLSTDTKPTPVAMGQELYTTDTGVIYKCKAKKNTEQFSVSHWKEI